MTIGNVTVVALNYTSIWLGYKVKNGVVERISCPTLVCDAEDDKYLKGQPQTLYDPSEMQKDNHPFHPRGGSRSILPAGRNPVFVSTDSQPN